MAGRTWLGLVLALTLVRGLLYAAVVPPWQAPDELSHFEHAWLLSSLRRPPSPRDLSPSFEAEAAASLYEWRFGQFSGHPLPEQMPTRLQGSRTVLARRFSPAYVWQALFILPLTGGELSFQLYAARLSSVLLNMAIVWVAAQTLLLVLPRQPGLAAAATAFVVFLPQHTFINASVNEGPLAELCACVALYGWLRLSLQGMRVSSALCALGGTIAGVFVKGTAAYLVPLGVIMVIALSVVRVEGASRRRRAAYVALSLAVAAFLVLVALAGFAGHRVRYVIQVWWVSPGASLDVGVVSVVAALWETLDSFWAQFGWMNVRAEQAWYALVYVLVALAVEGWLIPRARALRARAGASWVMAVALLVAIAVWVAFVLMYPDGLAYRQGRYLFPVTVPVAYFLVCGWARLTPPAWRRYYVPTVLAVLATLDAAAFCLTLWPYYYAG